MAPQIYKSPIKNVLRKNMAKKTKKARKTTIQRPLAIESATLQFSPDHPPPFALRGLKTPSARRCLALSVIRRLPNGSAGRAES